MSAAPLASRRRGTGTTRLVWQLAWPAIITNLLQSTVGLVNTKVVGSLGASAVAAVTVGQRIFFLQQVLLIAITTGTTALVARAWGAGDREEAARITRSSLWLCCIAGVLMMAPMVAFAEPLAGLFGMQPDAQALGAIFIRWTGAFSLPFAVGMALGAALRAAGDTRTPLWVGVVMNLVNVALAYGLVYGELGLPRVGIAGAAIANGVAMTLGGVLMLALWLRGLLVVPHVAPGGDFARERVLPLLRIGSPAGVEQLAVQIGFAVFVAIVSRYGTAANAAYGIGVSLLAFSFLIGLGFSIAASTLVGQRLGAGDVAGATRAGWRAMWLAIGAMVLFGTAIIGLAEPLSRFMIEDEEVIRLSVVFIYLLGSVQVLMAIEFTLGGALRGAGDTRFPLVVALAGLLGVRVTLALVFVRLGWRVEWVFAALTADYLVKGILLVARFRRGRWQHALGRAAPEPSPVEIETLDRAIER
jgi:putative MATE family efflux protein